ncbi:MAG: hypothetical protein ACRC9P_10400 [Bacteroides sp.]
MENKIQELTDKIYREGVEKANTEAQSLLQKTEEEAQRIVNDAKLKAETILKEAEKKSEELSDNTKSELKLFADQAINALKSEVTDLLVDEVVTKSVKKTTSDTDFLNQFILELAKNWSANEGVEISTQNADSLTAYFNANAKDLLDKGVTIKQVNGSEAQFAISPADGSYKVTFGEKEFIDYFKSFLRPKLISMLFGEK